MAQQDSATPPLSHSCRGQDARQAHDATAMFCRNSFRLYISAIVVAPCGHFRPPASIPIRASAKEAAPRAFPMFLSSQSRLITNSGRFGSSRNASNAQTVGTISGSPATPYTIGFPQFQPPPGHMRSYSIHRASSRRRAAPLGKSFTGVDASKIRASEVGSTQLLVCGVQPQPRYESFCSVIFRWENKRARQRRHVALSCGQSLQIHFTPAATASRACASAASTQQASTVTQDPLPPATNHSQVALFVRIPTLVRELRLKTRCFRARAMPGSPNRLVPPGSANPLGIPNLHPHFAHCESAANRASLQTRTHSRDAVNRGCPRRESL